MTASLFPVIAVVAALAPGPYRLVHDGGDVRAIAWDATCGALPVLTPDAKGTVYTVTAVDDGKTFAIDAPGRSLGSGRCEGVNSSLVVTQAFADGPRRIVRCASERVVKSTETTELVVEETGEGGLKLHTRSEREGRVRRNVCHVVVERHTILVHAEPDEVAAALEDPSVADGMKDAPVGKPAPAPPADAASIKKAVERELQRRMRETDYGVLKIAHEHKTSDDFMVLEARYVLDGKELKEGGRREWTQLKAGESRAIFDDAVPAGTHVLEVELVYKTEVDGQPAKLRLKDAVFFDVAKDKPVRVVLTGYEKRGFFQNAAGRTALQFTLNGKTAPK